MLTVTSAAVVTSLTTLDEALDYLTLTDTGEGTLTLRIQMLIDAASDAARQFCGRQFSRQTYTETVPAYGSPFLRLSERPIVSVSAVTLDGVPVTDFTIEDPGAGILYRKDNFSWLVGAELTLGGTQPLPSQEALSYSATYIAGYLLPGETGRTLPRDVEFAILETIKGWHSGDLAGPLKSVRVGPIQETYAVPTDFSPDEFPPEAVSILKRYRRLDRQLV